MKTNKHSNKKAAPAPGLEKIDKGIPIPARSNLKHPFKYMQIGDSFFTESKLTSITSAACQAARRHGMKFTARAAVENGVKGTRCWRIA